MGIRMIQQLPKTEIAHLVERYHSKVDERVQTPLSEKDHSVAHPLMSGTGNARARNPAGPGSILEAYG